MAKQITPGAYGLSALQIQSFHLYSRAATISTQSSSPLLPNLLLLGSSSCQLQGGEGKTNMISTEILREEL